MKPLGTFLNIKDVVGQEICSGDIIIHFAGRGRFSIGETLHVVCGITKSNMPKSIYVGSIPIRINELSNPLTVSVKSRRTSYVRIDKPINASRITEARKYIQENT